MNFFYLSFTCLVSCAFALDLTGVGCDHIRSCLLDALKRFHLKSPPLPVSPVGSVQTSSADMFERIPIDTKVDILEKFLAYDSFISLKQTNSHYAGIPDAFLFRRLAKFNPYYLVEDPIVNKLLFAVITKHFVKSKNLQNPHIYDELMLLILKFHSKSLDFGAIPIKIYFYIIAFINETVRGPDSGVPTSVKDAVIDLCRLITIFDMPKSLKFFKENRKIFSSIWHFGTEEFVADLDFLHSKPTKYEIMDHFKINASNVNNWFKRDYSCTIKPVIFEYFLDEISIDYILIFGCHFVHISNRQAFIKRLLLLPNIRQIMESAINIRADAYHAAFLCSMYTEIFDSELPKCYLLSRNVLTGFSWKPFLRIDDYPFCTYISSHLNLYQLELLAIFDRVGYCSIEESINRGFYGLWKDLVSP
jgi:hypothetical protein